MITFQIALASVSLQTLQVSMSVPATPGPLTLSLPSWIPGSYKIRDFAKNIGEFNAVSQNNTPMAWSKLDKQTWQIETNGEACTLTYTVIANDYSVRGAFISDHYAFFNGTSTFLQVKDNPEAQYQVLLQHDTAPTDWKPYTSMPEEPVNYYELIDHPYYWGVAQVQRFEVKGVEFTFLLSGEQPIDIVAICEDLTPICEHHLTLFKSPSPVEKYLFITLLADTGFGGLEHRDSTVLMYPRFDLPMVGEDRKASDTYIDYLSLCSHEFFHTWHVKRIRPRVMLQPDLSQEVYTPQLWIFEGFTSFYDDLAVARTGMMSPEHYCTVLGRHITRLFHTPGRHKQSVAESSFDAWTRFYQQDAHSNNHIVSYYTKGGIIALGLDILLREQSKGAISLDTLMQQLWKTVGKTETGTLDDHITQLCAELGVDVSDYISRVVYGTEDVDLNALLPSIGLTLNRRARINSADKGGTEANQYPKRDLGATLSDLPSMGCKVTQLQEAGAANKAGLQINDVILAADGWLANEALLRRMLEQSDSQSINLHVARQGRMINLSMPVQPAEASTAIVSIVDRERYLNWLGCERS